MVSQDKMNIIDKTDSPFLLYLIMAYQCQTNIYNILLHVLAAYKP